MLATGVPYQTYFAGAQFIHFWLGPAVVALALFAAVQIPTDSQGWPARRFAMGTSANGLGAARALQVNADAGAYAGLALGLQVVLASLLMPLVFRFF